MSTKVKVGQVWINQNRDRTYTITKIAADKYGTRRSYGIDSWHPGIETSFVALDPGDCVTLYFWYIVKNERSIPCIPLDPTLPILEAGHLQDRERKKYKK